jgi:hypothetical protein
MVRPTILVIPSTQLMAVTHVPVWEMVEFHVQKELVFQLAPIPCARVNARLVALFLAMGDQK